MGNAFEVLTSELESHASRVDALTDRLDTAVDAANTVTMNDTAYGVVCQPFATLLQPFEELGVHVLRQAKETLATSATKVRDTARTYTTTDTAHSTVFTSIDGDR